MLLCAKLAPKRTQRIHGEANSEEENRDPREREKAPEKQTIHIDVCIYEICVKKIIRWSVNTKPMSYACICRLQLLRICKKFRFTYPHPYPYDVRDTELSFKKNENLPNRLTYVYVIYFRNICIPTLEKSFDACLPQDFHTTFYIFVHKMI